MVKKCLTKEPDVRATAVSLLKDPFFKKVKDPDYLKETLLAKLPAIWERRGNQKSEPANNAAAPQKKNNFGNLMAEVDGAQKKKEEEKKAEAVQRKPSMFGSLMSEMDKKKIK